MAVTITNLSTFDIPLTRLAGNTTRRRQMLILSGTASAITDSVVLSTYIPTISTIDSAWASASVASEVKQAYTTGFAYGSGSIIVGTTNAYVITAIVTLT